MSKKILAVAMLCALPLAACQTSTGAGLGTLGGAVAGGFVGNQFGSGSGKTAATAAGAVVGALLGNQLGAYLDPVDRTYATTAQNNALTTGSTQTWTNPNTGRTGQVSAGNVYNNQNGTCREYTHTIYIDGQPRSAKGVACRQADGTWGIVS